MVTLRFPQKEFYEFLQMWNTLYKIYKVWNNFAFRCRNSLNFWESELIYIRFTKKGARIAFRFMNSMNSCESALL